MSIPSPQPIDRYRHKIRKSLKAGNLLWAIAIQVLILLGAVFVVVVVPKVKSDPVFESKKTIYLPQRELDHSIALAEFQQAASKPALMDRLTTEALLTSDMPAMPTLPDSEFNPMNNPDDTSLDASALLGASGLMGSLQGMVSESSSLSFFGIEDSATRIVIVFDVSQSVLSKAKKSGVSINKIREETLSLINDLNANSLFGLVQFSRSYDSFENYLIAGTRGNKEAVEEWLKTEFKTNGRSGKNWIRDPVNGIQSVVKAAFLMEPDVIFIISDGDFQRGKPTGGSENVPWGELRRDFTQLQEESENQVRVHFVGFQVKPAHEKELQTIVRRYGGEFRKL